MSLTVGSTYEFTLIANKDGVPWDLTGATLTLYLHDPNGVVSAKSASLGSSANVAVYDSLTSDLYVAGTWTRTWRVQHNGLDVKSRPKIFEVLQAP